MKRKTGGILLSCVMGAALLSGCASTIAPASESASHPTSQSAVDSDGASSEDSNAPADQPVSPAFTPAPATVPPRPEQTQYSGLEKLTFKCLAFETKFSRKR